MAAAAIAAYAEAPAVTEAAAPTFAAGPGLTPTWDSWDQDVAEPLQHLSFIDIAEEPPDTPGSPVREE